ncbi:S-layer homology domain-containing protein [Paenibacillus rhizophilus]|uniref:S-layer homology domain-containing protein n=1 Tax=Paenibacillus rhizophilus TaxID=1850366 RepID=A0A3N9PBY9_9BACL|nr:S-layer homology domain-containing protein [Paenibacillus rhizophilus]RQW13761.1 S-layer homology domain-containing protein [Paenibacillus rhizophilus]
MISTKKALAAFSISALMMLSAGGAGFAAGSGFTDLGSVQGKEKIESLKDRGLVKGVNGSQFMPGSVLSVAQGVQLISGGLQLSLAAIDFIKAPVASDIFTKVDDDAWYAEAFINAHYNGVDVPADLDPKEPMTKQQFTALLVQGLEKAGNLPLIKLAPVDIDDEDQIDPSHQGGIQRSLVYKITALDKDGKFNPESKLTRAEAAVMLYNALEYLKAHGNR